MSRIRHIVIPVQSARRKRQRLGNIFPPVNSWAHVIILEQFSAQITPLICFQRPFCNKAHLFVPEFPQINANEVK